MKTIKIFLASSAELSEDREEIREMISVENDRLHPKGIYLQLVQWEYFMDAVSEARLQDEYNKAIGECDVVLSLFYTKAGKYTQEEFQYAYAQFKATGKPLIYTYFKTAVSAVAASEEHQKSLAAFKTYLSQLGHFYSAYDEINDLKYKLKLQLDRLLESFHEEVPSTPARGLLLYKIPPKMQLQILHRCLIRVSYEKETILRDLPDYADEFVLREQVRMADSMEVILVENTAFEVMAINAEQQAVEKGDYTEWNFDVRPLQLGRFPLTFRVSMVLPNGLKQVVLTEAVEVVTEAVADVLEMKTAALTLDVKGRGETARGLESLPETLGTDDFSFQSKNATQVTPPPPSPPLPADSSSEPIVLPPPPPPAADPNLGPIVLPPPAVDPTLEVRTVEPPVVPPPIQIECQPTPVAPAPKPSPRIPKRNPMLRFAMAAAIAALLVVAGFFYLPRFSSGSSPITYGGQDSTSHDGIATTDTLPLPSNDSTTTRIPEAIAITDTAESKEKKGPNKRKKRTPQNLALPTPNQVTPPPTELAPPPTQHAPPPTPQALPPDK
jgi:hypothetical protein